VQYSVEKKRVNRDACQVFIFRMTDRKISFENFNCAYSENMCTFADVMSAGKETGIAAKV
jgi:hypothetical protein